MEEANLTADFVDYEQEGSDENTKRTIQLSFSALYGLLFICGTVGNSYVILMLIRVLASIFNKKTSAAQRMSLSGTTPVLQLFIYVLGLVDSAKVYWIGETVNKLLSSFLLTVLSWDRYMAVCSPITSLRFRSSSVAVSVLLLSVFVATLLLYPIIVGSSVHQIDRRTADQVDEMELHINGNEGSIIRNLMLQLNIFVPNWPRQTLNVVFFAAHFLLCFNSAVNPYLFALVNKELRHQHNEALRKRRKSIPLNAQRILSEKPSIIRDSISDYFVVPQRRHFSYHQQRHFGRLHRPERPRVRRLRRTLSGRRCRKPNSPNR
ncbi:G-PROTEIN-RECEP-F1-2 domain-containing protein [Aphelenchoides fujianensis]|nr:G-PROTEIN-RECEP-F1-2 domain-containing protein [Aphelenchoides fujianensis]